MKVLAGDLGGTRARLAIVEVVPGEEADEAGWPAPRPEILRYREYRSEEFDGLPPILARFLAEEPADPARVRMAVAGPVEAGRVRLPNLGWTLEEDEVAASVGVTDTRLVNDFTALARSLDLLGDADRVELQPGDPPPSPAGTGERGDPERPGPRVVLGAGTGLGQAFVLPRGVDPPLVVASEAGHADFAPGDARQDRLLAFLRDRYGHVSWERVLSGPGLEEIYRFFLADGAGTREPRVRDALESGRGAAAITEAGLEGSAPTCHEALELFVSVYGAQAGNLALTLRATGGVYLAGGIAPRLLPLLRDGPFLDAFRAKGRFSEFVRRVPVRVITETRAGLLGAAVWE